MQLKQKYTKDNITYENELFISEMDNIDIPSLINCFFNKTTMMEKPVVPEKSQTIINIVKEEKAPVIINEPQSISDEKCNISEDESETQQGYYIKFTIQNQVFEKWSKAKSSDNARSIVYNMAYKREKATGYKVPYEILEVKPMSLEEFNNRSK